jgi:hypothetical protein
MHPPNQINPVDQIVLADRRIRVVLCAVTWLLDVRPRL